MKKFLSKKYLFTSGLEKEQYDAIKSAIYEDNRIKLQTFSFLGAVFFSLMFLITFISSVMENNRAVYILGILVTGFISGVLLGGAFVLNQKDKINPYKRQLEKLSVVKDSSQSRVEVLEAKIKTLEAALQKSLDNN